MKNQFILNIKTLKVIMNELEGLLVIPIKYYSSSYIYNKIRSVYYKYNGIYFMQSTIFSFKEEVSNSTIFSINL
jgi:hypothetical protein